MMEGEFQGEGAAFSWGGGAVESAPVGVGHNLVTGGESHAGAGADGLGGEEGVKDFGLDVRRDPDAVVLNGDRHLILT